ncbi:hypothetical protein PsorP6_002419 [Peronosclerospora sorghi]|uniref:Uncharacterized protein n=1 Tax=Peronosclerospora sorghi TaxID=230839 RepID=A0ACC0WVS3_9STRA|nr:hypothetical protein PsorP6_002419 [Peronosclerospora sorghi]
MDAKETHRCATNVVAPTDVSTLTPNAEQMEATTGAALFDLSCYTGGSPLIHTVHDGAENTGSKSAVTGVSCEIDEDVDDTQDRVVKSLEGDEKKMGRPSHPAWQYFDRGNKRNRFHHNAYCRFCSENGADPVAVRGVSGNMIRHLQKCVYCPTEAVMQLKLLCAQKDAANFNKRHQSHNRNVDMLLQEMSSTPIKKIRRSDDEGNSVGLPLHREKMRDDEANKKANGAQNTPGVKSFSPPFKTIARDSSVMPSSRKLVADDDISSSSGHLLPEKNSYTKKEDELELHLSTKPDSHRPINRVDEAALNKLIVSSTLLTGLSWDYLRIGQSAQLFKEKLPGADLFLSLGADSNEKQILMMKDEQVGVTLAVNWWSAKCPRSSFVLLSLVNARDEVTMWELIDIEIEQSALEISAEDLAKRIKNSLASIRNRGIRVINIVADTALVCAASRIAVNSSEDTSVSIPVLPCFSHFLQTLLGIVMTKSDESMETVSEIIELTQMFSNRRVLKILQRECDDPNARLHLPTRQNWYSFVEAVDSIRHYEDMIKIISSKVAQASLDSTVSGSQSFNKQRKGSLRKDSTGNTVEELTECGLSSHIIRIIQNPEFWENVVTLSELMSPLKETCRMMCNTPTSAFSLSEIMYQFGRIQQQYRAILSDWENTAAERRSTDQVRILIQQVNDVWKLYDQPLMVLGYTFNYNLQHQLLARDQPPLQWLSIGKYAKRYFLSWFCAAQSSSGLNDKATAQFMEEFLAFKDRMYPFELELMCDFDNPKFFYMLISDSHPLMHMLGSRLFSFSTSTPNLSDVVPGKCFIPSASSTTCPQQSLLPFLRIKLFARTAARTSKDVLELAQSNRSASCAVNNICGESVSEAEKESSQYYPSLSTFENADTNKSDEIQHKIWNTKQWMVTAKDWKAHWENEIKTSNLLQSLEGFGNSTVDLDLNHIFKKLPSRVSHDREDSVVDV